MRVRYALALALIPVAAVAGCGGDDNSSDSNGVESKSATQILDQAAAALRRVKSFHVDAKTRTAKGPSSFTADVGLPGKLRLTLREGSGSASIVVVDGAGYIKGDAAYWRQHQAGRAAQQLAGKWLKSPTSSDLQALAKQLNPVTLSRCLAQDHGTIEKGGSSTVDGKPAIVLIDKGDRPGAAPGKLFVATTGEPLPLRTIATGNQRPGGTNDPACGEKDSPTSTGDEALFSRYDEPVDITAPPDAIDVGAGTAS